MKYGDSPVFLVGFMASGKTTVGRLLAGELECDFADTDELVEQREGRPIDRVFAESGEGHFRRVEWEVLQGLGGLARAVVATGGGLFLGHAQRRWMIGHGRTVWLDVPLELARERVAGQSVDARARPLWDSRDPVAQRALFERRRATYALADYRADASGSPAETVRVVERLLARGDGSGSIGRPRKPDFC